MKVALCQTNTTVGAFGSNLRMVLSFCKQAAGLGADLAVFPELVLSSYPPMDLIDQAWFQSAQQKVFSQFIEEFQKLPGNRLLRYVAFGAIVSNPLKHGKKWRNAAVLVSRGVESQKGSVQPCIQVKRLLPNYDVFDEARFFEPGTESSLVPTDLGKIGLSVCEDAWFSSAGSEAGYAADPARDLIGADFVINVSASPFDQYKADSRASALSRFAGIAGCPVFYVNAVGANDELLFDGDSRVVFPSGESSAPLPEFAEGISLVELKGKGRHASQIQTKHYLYNGDKFAEEESFIGRSVPQSGIAKVERALVTGIRDYFKKSGFNKAILGLSGGIDSAVVACLAVRALGAKNVYGVSMPGPFSSVHSQEDAAELAKNLGIFFETKSIKFIYKTFLLELLGQPTSTSPDLAEENLQARLRGSVLMTLAAKRNALVLATGNKSELAVGYCTLYGDMCGALAPIGDLFKTQVYDLARYLGTCIPTSTLAKPPSAELSPNQKDQDSLPEYADLDVILRSILEDNEDLERIVARGYDRSVVKKVRGWLERSEFKRRQAPPVLRVSSKAFGLGRRLPIVARYE